MNGSFVVSVVADVTLVTAGSLIAVRLARKSRAATRHLWLASSFVTLLLLPAVAVISPQRELAVPIVADSNPVAPAVDLIADAVLAAPSLSMPPMDAPEVTRRSEPSLWPALLLIGWLTGSCFCLAPMVIAFFQIRPLRRSGIRWPDGDVLIRQVAADLQLRSPIALLLHDGVSGPMTCGMVHPIVVLPTAAKHWQADALERSLVHELEHVRRRDWASHCLAHMICAVYWFHPLVWIARRQLTLEAERACDDAVVLRADATSYARQLVDLAKRMMAVRRQPVLEMASRRDLATRIRALLDEGQARGRAGGVSAALGWIVSVALLLTISPLRIVNASSLLAQALRVPLSVPSDAGARPQFEVVSIRPAASTPGSRNTNPRAGIPGKCVQHSTFDPGRVDIRCYSLGKLIWIWAFGIPPSRLAGLSWMGDAESDWSDGPCFDIEATLPEGTSRDQVPAMLRDLLVTRFKLATHREYRDELVYALVEGKDGFALPTAEPNVDANVVPKPPTDEFSNLNGVQFGTTRLPNPDGSGSEVWILHSPRMGTVRRTEAESPTYVDRYEASSITLDGLADLLTVAGISSEPVVNATGAQGRYRFTLEISKSVVEAVRRDPTHQLADIMDAYLKATQDGLKKLGLQLERRKVPVEVLVIDNLEKTPTDK
jgi:uncharacterized protein (TIGR03435 family)